MKRNKLKVLSSLAILGIAGLGLAACNNNNTGSGTTQSPTPTPTENGGGATTPTPTPTPVPTTPSQSTTTTPNQSSTNTPEQNKIESISVSGQTKEFLPGSEFVFGGTVTKNYSDGSQVVATEEEYIVTIYTDNSYETEAENIKTAGTYYVVVSIGDKLATYEIVVREKQYKLVTMFDPANNTAGNITENKELYNANGNKVSVLANTSRNMTIEANKYNKIEGYNFTSRLKLNGTALGSGATGLDIDSNGNVTNTRVVVIELEKDANVNIFARTGTSNETRTLAITNNGTYTKELSCADDMQKQTVSLKAGKYYVYSKSGGINIYGIEFETEVPASSVTYSEIKVDTSNAKTDFNKGDEFATTGLVVKGLNNYGVWDILDSSDYTITNEDDSAVDTTTVGRKTIKVTAKGHSDTYVIQVINPNATIESITVKEDAKEVYKQGEEISFSGLVITSTDSDSLTQDIAYDAEKITFRVLNGETDVTSQFTTLTKGTYTVELTYASKTTTYNITMLEVKERKFEYVDTVAEGTTSYQSSLIVSYTDGTDADWSKYNETILSTVEGYSTKFYSDADCTVLIDTATNAFASVGTVYMKLSYQDYSETHKISVISADGHMKYTIDNSQVSSSKLTSLDLIDNELVKITARNDSKSITTSNGINYLKLDAFVNSSGNSKDTGIDIVVKQDIEVIFVLNASGDNKVYTIADANGTVISTGKVSKTSDAEEKLIDGTVVKVTLKAGTYKLYAEKGGILFGSIEATKAE